MAAQLSPEQAQKLNYVAAVVPADNKIRLEIDEFLDDNAMTNLFLIALTEMQKEDPKKRQADKTEDWWTFYSLSSIHGQPSELWNGISGKTDPKADPGSGYCTHGSFVFPTWHRVYILMFEVINHSPVIYDSIEKIETDNSKQAVANKMRDIAQRYTDASEKKEYINAAERFRFPYWDPFVPRNRVSRNSQATEVDQEIWGLPKILMAEAVYVKYPNKSVLKAIANPLRAYVLPDEGILSKKGRKPLNLNWGRYKTVRSPTAAGDPNYYGDSGIQSDGDDRQGLVLKIQRQGKNLSTKLFNLLSTYDDDKKNKSRTWESFASHRVSESDRRYVNDTSISLESWHDTIHGLVGAGALPGHMGNPAVAGFDPIFWLHHCNIDRLFAIYQALYPNNWVSSDYAVKPTSSLFPFLKEDKEFWISDDVKDWTKLGFAVPGNKRLDEKRKKDLEAYLDENYHWAAKQHYPPESITNKWPRDLSHSVALYGDDARVINKPILQFEALSNSGLVSRRIEVESSKAIEPVDESKNVIFKDISNDENMYPEGSLLPDTNKPAQRTWNAQIHVEKFAFNGPFAVHLFIGHIKNDQPERFMTKKNEVGYSYVFASQPDAPCANCAIQREEGFLYEDAIPITTALTKYLTSYTKPDGPDAGMRTLQSFEPEHVVPFLKEHLNWVITDGGSGLLDNPTDIRNSKLEVSVWDRLYDLPTPENRLGCYYPAQLHREVTQGQLGGLSTVGEAQNGA